MEQNSCFPIKLTVYFIPTETCILIQQFLSSLSLLFTKAIVLLPSLTLQWTCPGVYYLKSLSSGWEEADPPDSGHQHNHWIWRLTLKASEQSGYSTVDKSRFFPDGPPSSKLWLLDLWGMARSNEEVGNHTAEQEPFFAAVWPGPDNSALAPTHENS